MTHPYNETEARIDRVLNALRDTQPSPGLNARIADRITDRFGARAEARFTDPIAGIPDARNVTTPFFAVILNAVKDPRILFAGAPLYTLAATSLAILATLSLIVLHSHHPTTTQSQVNAPIIQSQTSAQDTSLSTANKPDAIAAQNPNTPTPSERATLQHSRTTDTPNTALAASTHPQPASLQPTATPTDPDTIALAETLAPSHPAPPMPLTQQELLTLAVLRSGDKEEIAALNPVHRETLFAQEQAAFHNFFAPSAPPTLETTTGDNE